MRALVGGVLGFLSASVVWLLVADDGDAPPRSDQRGALTEAVAGLAGEVDRLARAVASLESRDPMAAAVPAATTATPVVRQPLPDDGEGILAELQAMRGDLRRFSARGPAAAEALLGGARPTRIDRVRAFHADCLRDRDAALANVILMGRSELLATFGKPTSAWVGQARELHWVYRIDGTEFTLDFHDGVVVNISYSEP